MNALSNLDFSGGISGMSAVFVGLTIGAAVFSSFATDIRRAILGLWVAGLSIGALYLTLGAELLATTQWIISTLVTIAFIFFSVMFGEFNRKARKLSKGDRFLPPLLASIVGLAFTAVIFLGSASFENSFKDNSSGTDLSIIGKTMVEDHLLSLEVLALTLFMVLIGGGVIARPETKAAESEEPS
jgi:NADH:ubiquinone oxidoreductase subunit 6 (subunit J)